MSRVFIVALREVRSYLQDKADLILSLLLPVAIFALMYGAFSGQSLFNRTAHIVNKDPEGIYSQRLIECLNELENLEVNLLTWQEANIKLARSDVLLVSYIPEDFSAQLSSGWPTQIIFHRGITRGRRARLSPASSTGKAIE